MNQDFNSEWSFLAVTLRHHTDFFLAEVGLRGIVSVEKIPRLEARYIGRMVN